MCIHPMNVRCRAETGRSPPHGTSPARRVGPAAQRCGEGPRGASKGGRRAQKTPGSNACPEVRRERERVGEKTAGSPLACWKKGLEKRCMRISWDAEVAARSPCFLALKWEASGASDGARRQRPFHCKEEASGRAEHWWTVQACCWPSNSWRAEVACMDHAHRRGHKGPSGVGPARGAPPPSPLLPCFAQMTMALLEHMGGQMPAQTAVLLPPNIFTGHLCRPPHRLTRQEFGSDRPAVQGLDDDICDACIDKLTEGIPLQEWVQRGWGGFKSGRKRPHASQHTSPGKKHGSPQSSGGHRPPTSATDPELSRKGSKKRPYCSAMPVQNGHTLGCCISSFFPPPV